MAIGCIFILALDIYRIKVCVIPHAFISFEYISLGVIDKNHKIIYVADCLSGHIILKRTHLLLGERGKLYFHCNSSISFRERVRVIKNVIHA